MHISYMTCMRLEWNLRTFSLYRQDLILRTDHVLMAPAKISPTIISYIRWRGDVYSPNLIKQSKLRRASLFNMHTSLQTMDQPGRSSHLSSSINRWAAHDKTPLGPWSAIRWLASRWPASHLTSKLIKSKISRRKHEQTYDMRRQRRQYVDKSYSERRTSNLMTRPRALKMSRVYSITAWFGFSNTRCIV